MKTNKATADILADELENWYPTINLCMYSAQMLRQQKAEIERLNFYLDGLLEENEKLRNQRGYSCGIGCEYPKCNCWKKE